MRAGKRRLIVGLAAALAVSAASCGQSSPTWPFAVPTGGPTTAPSAGPSDGLEMATLPGESATASPGPDLGEAWTTEPDPETFIPLADGTMVAPDQYLVMLDRSATQAEAQKIAASVDGTIGGHIEYIGVWKILVWPNYHTAIILDRLRTLEEQPGVLVATTVGLAQVDAAPDCAPGLADAVYSGVNTKPYDMIGVKAAWQAFYASGLPIANVHVGFVDTELTRDPKGRIAWEFDDVTFVGDPHTTPDPLPVTATNKRTDGFHHADGTLGILAGDGQNGGITGIASPLGTRLMVSHDLLGGPASAGQPSKWTTGDGLTYADDTLLKTLRQVESGAKVISGSFGGYDKGDALMWKSFFDQMAKDHPDVLFVYSAGNDKKALESTTHYPGGVPAPNVITVGSEDTDLGRTSYSNGLTTGSTGEVTLGAPGHQAVWGKGVDGKVKAINGGTSSAAPMVSATAALIKSIDPSLTAADVKKLIADTAVTGDPELGGKSLRVDLAVRKAIDGVRERKYGLPPLTDAQIAAATAYCQIDVTSSLMEQLTQPAGATRWSVLASIGSAVGKGRMVELSVVEDGLRPANATQAVTAGGAQANWSLLVSANGAWIVVTRHDNGYWVKRRIGGQAAPTPTPEPSATEAPLPTPTAGSTYDCSNPPEKGTIAYQKWSLHCKPIGS